MLLVMARLSLFRFRFSLLALSKISTKKLLVAINLGIFVSIFAVSAAIISIYFENKIDKIERRIIEQETNYIVYNNWLNRAPKIINEINIIVDQKKQIEDYAPILKELIKNKHLSFYDNRREHHNYFFKVRNLIETNFQVIILSLSDAVLVADSKNDIETIIEKRLEKNKLIRKFDETYYKQLTYKALFSDKVKISENKKEIDYDRYYSGYADFNKEQKPLLISQRKFFLEFALKYFSLKKLNFQKDIIILQDEITKLSKLESNFILAAFFIQFIIFLLVQFFEITIEQGNMSRRKKK